MQTVLRLDTSILGPHSVSRQLTDELLAGLRDNGDDFRVIERDFSRTPIPHVDGHWLSALGSEASTRSEAQQALVEFSDALIAELRSADLIVMGLPMYNFSVPSMLKAWQDHVARAGVTFKYTESGPRGLLTGKQAVLVCAMGGVHNAGESDFLRPYVRHFLGFLGISDVKEVTAEGLAISEEHKQRSLERARQQLQLTVSQIRQDRRQEAA